MDSSITLVAVVSLGFVLVGILAILVGWRSTSNADMDRRMQEYVAEPSSALARWPVDTLAMRRPELRGSFVSRTIAPLFRYLANLFGRFTPASSIEKLEKDLTTAAAPPNLGAREFYGLRLIFILLGFLFAYIFYTRLDGNAAFLMAALVFVVFAYMPNYWLKRRIRIRRDKIKRSLPDALDMLSVCADAGLGFDQSMQRVSESWKTVLGLEFGRVVKEMSLGVSRAAALRSMADRIGVVELSSFVALIVQSEQLGMSIAETLHTQAFQMRVERRYWAQEQARKLPIKMLFPLMFLILPALFVVVLGPALPTLSNMFGSGGVFGP